MQRQSISRGRSLLGVITAAGLAIAVLFVLRNRQPGAEDSDRKDTLNPFVVSQASLQALKWEDIGCAVEAIGKGEGGLQEGLEMIEFTEHPPTIYVRGLLLLADGHPREALSEFDRIPLRLIPAAHLYGPCRLASKFRPREPNAYLACLRDAVDAGEVPPLIQARVETWDGRLLEGLTSYLKTDPARWTAYDVDCIQMIARHSGLQSEVQRMIQGAFAAKRIPAELASDLYRVAKHRIEPEAESELKCRLISEMPLSGGFSQLAVASASKMLRTRESFLEQEYGNLLERHKDVEAVNQTSELVLVLFLAAVAEEDKPAVYRWGQELKRRHRKTGVSRWVDRLTGAPQAGQ